MEEQDEGGMKLPDPHDGKWSLPGQPFLTDSSPQIKDNHKDPVQFDEQFKTQSSE